MGKGQAGCASVMSLGMQLPPGVDHPEITIPGVGAAADQIAEHLLAGEKIAVFSDYDPDGTSGSACLSLCLSDFSDQVEMGFADSSRGTGLNPEFVEQQAARGVKTIITVDLGSSDPGVIELARSLGVQLVVSDHHAPHPEADPEHHLNPALHGTSEASGAVVAYKLALALSDRLPGGDQEQLFHQGAFLASFGARADMMDMTTDENRALFAAGQAPPGLALAARVMGLKSLSATNCTKIAALLNLPKRSPLARAEDAALVLSARSQDEAREPLERLLEVKERCAEASSGFGSEAARQILEQGESRVASAVIGLPDAHLYPGYAGIVALRMSGASKRPALILLPLDQAGSRYKYSLRWTEAPDGEGLLSSIPPLSEIAQKAGLAPPGGHPKAMGGLCRGDDVESVLRAVEDWAESRSLPLGSFDPPGDSP